MVDNNLVEIQHLKDNLTTYFILLTIFFHHQLMSPYGQWPVPFLIMLHSCLRSTGPVLIFCLFKQKSQSILDLNMT